MEKASDKEFTTASKATREADVDFQFADWRISKTVLILRFCFEWIFKAKLKPGLGMRQT